MRHPLLRVVARAHGITVDEMIGPSRKRHIVNARSEFALTLRAFDWSHYAIGEQLGLRDHSTVMNLCMRPIRINRR